MQHTATHCNTLQHTATHCNTLQHTITRCNTLQLIATHWNTLQHTTTHCNTLQCPWASRSTLQHTITRCNTLQHIATHCNTLQNSAAHYNTLQHTTMPLSVTQEALQGGPGSIGNTCNTLQHTVTIATHCNTPQCSWVSRKKPWRAVFGLYVTCCFLWHQTATHCHTLQTREYHTRSSWEQSWV